MSRIRVLCLSSKHPDFGHSHAHDTVLAGLLEAMAELGHQVSWAVVCPTNQLHQTNLARLETRGVRYLGDFSEEVDIGPQAKLARTVLNLRKTLLPRDDDDLPRFRNPERTAARIKSFGVDVALLFWDSWFEHLLPALTGLPVVGYRARPRYAAPMSRFEAGVFTKKLREKGLKSKIVIPLPDVHISEG